MGDRDVKVIITMKASQIAPSRALVTASEMFPGAVVNYLAAMADDLFQQLYSDLLDDHPGVAAICHFAHVALHARAETDMEKVVDLRIALQRAGESAIANAKGQADGDQS